MPSNFCKQPNQIVIAVLLLLAVKAFALEYDKVPLEKPARCFAVSEDGKLLIAAHEEDDLVTVWNADPIRQVAKIECPKPRYVISRGNMSFVASYEDNLIRVIEHDSWTITKSIKTGWDRTYYLSAPRGEYFKSRILATCKGIKSSNKRPIVLIDVEQQRAWTQHNDSGTSIATFSYTGERFIKQFYFAGSPAGHVSGVFEFSSPESVQARSAATNRNSSPQPPLAQVRAGTRWFGRNRVHIGNVPRNGGAPLGKLVVPDSNRDVIYVFDGGNIRCRALDFPLTEVGSKPLAPPPYAAPFDYQGDRTNRWMYQKDYIPPRPVAMTIDDKLFIFALDMTTGSLVRAALPAFSISGEIVAKTKKHLEQPVDLPKKIPAGKPYSFPLFGHETVGEYSVRTYSKAKNVTIDAKGVFHWTPDDEQIGQHRMIIEVGGSRYEDFSMTFNPEVVEAALLPVELGGTGEAALFEKIDFGAGTIAATITEDRKFLLAAHELENKVSVWEIATGKTVATFSTPKPVFIISRSDKAYVANGGKGTISIHSSKHGWKLVNQLEVGAPDVLYLSAAQGKFFDGNILATSRNERAAVMTVVDEQSDTHKTLKALYSWYGVGIVSYDGKWYLRQPVGSSSRIEGVFPFTKTDSQSKPTWKFGELGSRPLRQVRPGRTWHGWNQVVKAAAESTGNRFQHSNWFLIPDLEQFVVYKFEGTVLKCTALDESNTDLGTRRIVYPDLIGKRPSRERRFIPKNFGQHFAFTIDDKLHVVLLDGESAGVFHASMPAFQLSPLVAAAAERDCGGVKPFPESVAVGSRYQYSLFGKPLSAEYELVTSIEGATISDEGLLTWTPTSNNLGDVKLKIRASLGDDLVFVRLATKVTGTPATPSPSVPVASKPGRHVFPPAGLRIGYGFEGQSILVWNNESLSVLDREGMHLKKQFALTKRYSSIAAREDYLMAAGEGVIDFLASDTGKVTKTIRLKTSLTPHLIQHPAKSLSYFSERSREHPDEQVTSYPVFELNEATGEAKRLARVYGQTVMTDPQGRYLFTTIHGRITNQGQLKSSASLVRYSLGQGGQDVKHFSTTPVEGARHAFAIMAPHGRSFVLHHDKVFDPRENKSEIPLYPTAGLDSAPITTLQLSFRPFLYCFHPTLDLMVLMDQKNFLLVDSQTGNPFPGAVEIPEGVVPVFPSLFTPSGTHLLITQYDANTKTSILKSLPLDLTQEQRAQNGTGFKAPPLIPLAKQPNDKSEIARREYSPDKLDALLGQRGDEMPLKKIAQTYSDAVVVVRGGDSQCTGFVVGKSGYVLTASRALPPFGDLNVLFQLKVDGKTTSQQSQATIVRADDQLTLLKIDAPSPLTPVSLGKTDEADVAEDATIISCVDASASQLSHSIDQGYVRNVGRLIEDQPFLQTSISPDPKFLGAPIFSSRGRVIGVGMPIARGARRTTDAENLFAVPVKSILAFLNVDQTNERATGQRTWTDSTGRFKLKAELIKVENDFVYLKRNDGKTIRIPLSRLSAKDQLVIRDQTD